MAGRLRSARQAALAGFRGALVASLWGDYYHRVSRTGHRDFDVRIDNFKYGVYLKSWTLEVIHHPTRTRWEAQATLDTKALEDATTDEAAQMLLDDTILRLARQVAPHMYHLDPRIGTMFTGVNGDPLPSCPLFDRIDGAGFRQEQALRTLTTKTAQLQHLTSKTPSEVEPAIHGCGVPHTCPFCRESLLFPVSGKAVVWGGGALCWTHKECLPA